jgi:hypothetical protein
MRVSPYLTGNRILGMHGGKQRKPEFAGQDQVRDARIG